MSRLKDLLERLVSFRMSVNSDNHRGYEEPVADFNCRSARELIDRLKPLTPAERVKLQSHLNKCASCSAAADMEESLRETITPVIIPTPSKGFEEALMAELDLTLQSEPKRRFLNVFGWLIPLIASVLIGIYFVKDARWFAYKFAMQFTGIIADIFIQLDAAINDGVYYILSGTGGGIGNLVGGSINIAGLNSLMLMNIFLVMVVIFGGAIAVRAANER